MSVLDRDSLQASPLADLHTIASELSIDGFRRLRRAELIDAIVERQGGSGDDAGERETQGEDRQRESASGRRRRSRRGGRGRDGGEERGLSEGPEPERPARAEDQIVEGVVELLPNGSGFLRVDPPDPSDEDVYISAGQVKRCELVSGDRVTGPRRAPRRSERFASLVKLDTINGAPAEEIADGARFDELPAGFAQERFRLGSEDPTLKAIEWLTPFGRGSRVGIVGESRSGKTETIRRLAEVLSEQQDLQLFLALAGVRPEEISEWNAGPVQPSAAASFAASADAQDHAVELVVDQARRLAARGAHAVVLIDTLQGMHAGAARKALGAARRIVDGGTLTVIGTATEPFGGETTVIALDAALTSAARFPALDLVRSGTLRPELLVGREGAAAIVAARAEVLDEDDAD
jgi:transcription termination factor Rho